MKTYRNITPVLLLTGYLGSGKTTLVNHILQNKKGIRFAVIVNDIGEVNIDASLIQKGGVVDQKDESLVALQNGCICCTLKMNLVEQYDFPIEVQGSHDDELLFQRMCEQHPQAKLPESNPEAYDNDAQFTDYVERYRDMPLWQKMELRGAILVLFSRFLRQAVPHVWTSDDRMKRVQEHIHQHICENLDVDELADVACVTKPYLIRLFKRECGTSPVQYINRKKVERAQLLLYTTDMPVKEVAYEMGFSDHSYFIRMFKKQTDITPQEYRERMRK